MRFVCFVQLRFFRPLLARPPLARDKPLALRQSFATIGLMLDGRTSTSKLSIMLGTQTKAPRKTGALRNSSGPQAATLVGLTSRSLLELVIGIARGFMVSGISRTRSTCRSPFSRLASLT